MLSLGPDLEEHTLAAPVAPGRGGAWPGLLVFVVNDQWQRQIVYEVTKGFACEDQVQVRCIADGTVEGPVHPRASRQWVGQTLWRPDLGGWTLQQRLESSLWSQRSAITAYRLLLAAAEWKWMAARFARHYCTTLGDPSMVKKTLKYLTDLGYLRRVEHKNRFLYLITHKGIDRLSRIDWIFGRDIHGSISDQPRDAVVLEHDLRALEMLSGFLEHGLAIGAAWRYQDGQGGRVVPDGLVYLNDGPHGPGWHFGEYERSARGRSGATRKLRGYTHPRRRGTEPVLFAVRDARMEQHLQDVGRGTNLRLITTTFRRLKTCHVVGETGCWSVYGEQVSLG